MSRPGLPRPLLMVLGSIVSVQLGSAVAKNLFPAVGALAMVWLRVAMAGLLMLVVVRPHPRGHSRRDWLALAWYVVSLIGMNVTFYQAIARIPLGLGVTIEFLGPLTVAIIRSRSLRDLVWIGLAGAGVVLLGWSPGSHDWVGIDFGLLAAICWGSYILATPHVGQRWPGVEPIIWANLTGAVVLAVPVLTLDAARLGHPWIWLGGLGVGLLSSVLPYALELNALRSLDQRIFSIMMSLEPAVAALFALILLGEALNGVELVAMACVIAASAGITWSAGRERVRHRSPEPPPATD